MYRSYFSGGTIDDVDQKEGIALRDGRCLESGTWCFEVDPTAELYASELIRQ